MSIVFLFGLDSGLYTRVYHLHTNTTKEERMISLEDRSAITELIALHGHLVDDGRLEELNLMFAEDVTHDLTAFGLGVHHGLCGIRESALALGDTNPIGHHVTNIVIVEVKDDNTVVTRSKGIGIRADGTAGS